MKRSTVLIEDIGWAEGPRWRDGLLYFSDIYGDRTVQTVDEDGTRTVIIQVPPHPSGLGWLPGGDLLVVSMDDKKLLRIGPDGTSAVHADLSAHAVAVNDMFVLPDGTAYVGDNGFRYGEEAPEPGRILRVAPDGDVRVVAEGLALPNGLVATSDSSVLVVAETLGGRLRRFAIGEDGRLGEGEVFLASDELSRSDDVSVFFDLAVFVTRPFAPDGLAMDPHDRVWVGNPFSTTIRCYDLDGQVVEEVELTQGGVAPAVADDSATLFVATGDPAQTFTGRTSRVEIARL